MARERYLVNAGEDTIHDPEAEKKAEEAVKTPKGKWNNFWFYHKLHVVIGVVVAAIVITTIVSATRTVQPDYTVGLISQNAYPDSVTTELGQMMSKYGVDRNHDGKVVVQVQMYQIPALSSSSGTAASSGPAGAQVDPQVAQAYQVKLIGDIQGGTSMIFITDKDSFIRQEKSGDHVFAYNEGTTPPDNATDYDKMRIPLSKCPKFANLKVTYKAMTGSTNVKLTDILKDGGISLRVYKGSAIEGKQDDYYRASKELFQKLIS